MNFFAFDINFFAFDMDFQFQIQICGKPFLAAADDAWTEDAR